LNEDTEGTVSVSNYIDRCVSRTWSTSINEFAMLLKLASKFESKRPI
jgi:hypothetical protein